MTVDAATQETATVDGPTVRFCSEQCRATFADAPARYLAAIGVARAGQIRS
jgi:YHS domain-containing protein